LILHALSLLGFKPAPAEQKLGEAVRVIRFDGGGFGGRLVHEGGIFDLYGDGQRRRGFGSGIESGHELLPPFFNGIGFTLTLWLPLTLSLSKGIGPIRHDRRRRRRFAGHAQEDAHVVNGVQVGKKWRHG
jgi:hypothetical protein